VTTPPEYPSADLIECPFPFYEQARNERPVYKSPHRDEYLVFAHADIQTVLGSPDIFSEQMPEGGQIMWKGESMISQTSPPKHRDARNLAYKPLTPRRLESYEPVLYRAAETLIGRFIDRGEMEFMREFALPYPTLFMCEVMGLPNEGEEFEFLLGFWGNRVEHGDGTIHGGVDSNYFVPLLEYFERQLVARIENPTDDLLTRMLDDHVEARGEVDLPHVTLLAAELLFGGAGTTGMMMSNAMYLLLTHPEQLSRVRADHSLIPAMLEEALRVESVTQELKRVARKDVELSGVTIPAGSRVRIVLGSGNRDAALFENADEFDIERPNAKRHLAFGHGIHFCLGAPLARLEGRIAFERLFTRLGEIRLAESNDFRHIDSTHTRAFRRLKLEFDEPEVTAGPAEVTTSSAVNEPG
jgi:cytochrome P450